ncbi:MAG: tetratricopeptide repeat protein [Magnetococcales bacterium]|nr:tetratricopeptide repeat protein [Magnetococcales bacterium]
MADPETVELSDSGQAQSQIDAWFTQALDHYYGERFVEADQLCTAIINIAPNHVEAINLLGVIAAKINRHELAVEQFLRAINIDNSKIFFYYNLASSLYQLGRLKDVIDVLNQALEKEPENSQITHYLDNISNNPDTNGEFLSSQSALDIGVECHQSGQLNAAIYWYNKTLKLQPENSFALSNIGVLYHGQNRPDIAAEYYQKAILLQPDNYEAHSNLGVAFFDQGKFNKAAKSHKKAIAIKADYVQAHYNLANALTKQEKFAKAIDSYQKAIEIKPDYAKAYSNFGNLLQILGKFDKAISCYKKALLLSPDLVKTHDSLIFCLDLICDINSDLFLTERANWAKQHADPLKVFWTELNNLPDPERMLRIGYVGADFKEHSASSIFATMLLNHNHNKFQIYCYAGNTIEDDLTEKFKENSTSWVSTVEMDDATLAQKIKQDGIDILVDLAGHTIGNRLLTFARKPAPIQISAWGYPLGTAMAAMDYLFVDKFFIPATERKNYTETLVDLPCVIHMMATTPFPKITDPPFFDNGYITFGAFNRLEKNNVEVYALWADILLHIPTAKLLIKTVQLDHPQNVKEIISCFKNRGVDKNRLIFIGKTSRQDHIKAHGQVDIMLDPFPHSSGMTSLESLRMGVPVLNCEAKIRNPISSSLLHILGLDEWRTKNATEYVDKAVKFAKDVNNLKSLRHQLRKRFDKSVLGDSQLYTQQVEEIYLQLWQKWCKTKKLQIG